MSSSCWMRLSRSAFFFSPNEAICVDECIFYDAQCRWMNILCFTMPSWRTCFNHIKKTPPKHEKRNKSFPSEDRRWCTLATGGTASEAPEKPAKLGRADGAAPGRSEQPVAHNCCARQVMTLIIALLSHCWIQICLYIGTWNHYVYRLLIIVHFCWYMHLYGEREREMHVRVK